jgi:hypothetical protein
MESLLQGSQSGLKPRKLFLVGENEAELDELEHVDVALEGGVVVLILVVGLRRQLPYERKAEAARCRLRGRRLHFRPTPTIVIPTNGTAWNL